ncbi:MCE family protein [Nocardioides caeni]|uniref:MCE family protein n=2 Tax=Nocardioides caeni TaxID=574700 RepID=A0A4S8N321_9ACTN|nr:MCE family protein [Nocardioides caeni]
MTTMLRNGKVVALVVGLALVAALLLGMGKRDSGTTVTVYFTSASALYAGNPVEVLGVPVGSAESVTPEAGRVKVVLSLDEGVDLPADVQAFQVAPSLISGRTIQLAPAYDEGEKLADGATIPVERSQVPLDVNDLYNSAQELTDALGPEGANKDGALTRALDVLADNLEGNGESLASAISGLADASGVLAGSREDLTGTVQGLQTFVSTLAENDADVRDLNTQLATVSEFLADDRTELSAALSELSTALVDMAGFVKDNRGVLRRNVTKLTRVTRVLVRNRDRLASIVDEAPAGLGNLLNAYDAAGGTLDVRMDVNELMLGPSALVCELISRGTPGQLPAGLSSLCQGSIGALTTQVPSVAQLLAVLQGSAPQLVGGER